MFRRITIKNFRTHVNTTLELGGVTLIMGSNNAGKSNLFAGIRLFSLLTARGRPFDEQLTQKLNKEEIKRRIARANEAMKIRHSDFFPHRHRLAPSNEPMSFSCLWSYNQETVEYSLELFENPKMSENVGCWEKITIGSKSLSSNREKTASKLTLRETVASSSSLSDKEQNLANLFFRDLSSCYLYDFQPSFLSGQVSGDSPTLRDNEQLKIAGQLGIQGGNLQQILARIQKTEPKTYNNFVTKLQRFEKRFRGIRYDEKKDKTMWLFDIGKEEARSDEFPPDVVSSGTLRAAAVALLSSMQKPPALILLEEIENGINQTNLGDFLRWIQQAAGTSASTDRGYKTQFIVTTHSPSVLREFADHLDDAYNVRLETKGHKSVVIDINSFLTSLVNMGTVEGDFERKNGKEVVKVAPEKITELWYSGIIGGK